MSAPMPEDWAAPVALAFYAAASGTGSFADALGLCRTVLGADTSFYYVGRLDDGTRFDQHVSGAISLDRIDEYTQRWARLNPRQSRAWAEAPDGQVFDFERIVPAEAFVGMPVWREFMRQHVPMLHALGLAVRVAPGLQARFGIGRLPESGPFPDAARARFGVLAPHLLRAARARLRLLDAEAASLLPEAATGVLDLAVARYDRTGRYLGANAAMRRLAARGDGITLGPAGIVPTRPGDKAALADAIRNPGDGTRLAIGRGSGAVPYVVDVVATPPPASHVLVIVTDPVAPSSPESAGLAMLFGLSGPQAELARDIAGGVPLAAHAAAAGVPLETARSRLKAVLARTGCRRQADLAALVARLPALRLTP
jgi:hypothetical protein